MRRLLICSVAALAMIAASAVLSTAGTLSKTYVFKAGTVLEISADMGEGLRLDSVEFEVPRTPEGRDQRVAGLVKAKVAVSNLGEKPKKVGVALALLDAGGALVAVASGGSQLGSVKPGRQVTFTLVFDHVNRSAPEAASFMVALETR